MSLIKGTALSPGYDQLRDLLSNQMPRTLPSVWFRKAFSFLGQGAARGMPSSSQMLEYDLEKSWFQVVLAGATDGTSSRHLWTHWPGMPQSETARSLTVADSTS